MSVRVLLSLIICSLLFVTSSFAEQRGLVTSSNCPLSCQELGVAKQDCRSWSAGERCFVEDLSQAPGHRSLMRVDAEVTREFEAGRVPATTVTAPENEQDVQQNADSGRRGLMTTSSCPFDCKEAGIPSQYCRASQNGDKCTVEDLRQAPGHRSMVRVGQ